MSTLDDGSPESNNSGDCNEAQLGDLPAEEQPNENGLKYSPLVPRKQLTDEDKEESVATENVPLTSATSIEQELIKECLAGNEGYDAEVVSVSKVTITKRTTVVTTTETTKTGDEDFAKPDVTVVSETIAEEKETESQFVESSFAEIDPELIISSSQYPSPNVGDQLKPAKSLISIRPEDPVLLRYTTSGDSSDTPILVTTMIERNVTLYPDRIALAVKRNDEWKKWTYTEFFEEIKAVAKAFISLGLERYHGVGILGFNSPEWFIANFAAIYAGGLSTGIYATNNPDACKWPLQDSKANICVVENDRQLEKILSIWQDLPDLKNVISWTGRPSCQGNPRVYAWPDIVERGHTLPSTDLDLRVSDLAVNQCCTLIYTSGTTGKAKGVMLSHDNLTWTAAQCTKAAKLKHGEESAVSYLPLSHIAAQMLDLYIPYSCGASMYVAQPDALKGSLVNTLQEVRPTILLGVPRVWEKFQEKITEQGLKAPALKKQFIRWAKSIGSKGSIAIDNGAEMPTGWNLANSLVFKKVRHGLGIDSCRLVFTGAAPIMLETLEFFRSLNIRILDAYGMSECSAPHTIQFPYAYKLGSSGKCIPGVVTHINEPGDDNSGEICMEGRHVFMGYLNNKAQTLETIDKNGWLHSGDVGKIDENGFLFITGRIKELIITAGGENIAPVSIEDMLKNELPAISNAMLIGDRRKFLSVLITLKTDVDLDTGIPKDRLTTANVLWTKSLGSRAHRLTDVIEKTDLSVLKAIQAAIDKVNEKATSQAQRIQKWTLLPRDFSIPGGELGPTMKVRRPIVVKMYKDTIESFYSSTTVPRK